MMNIKKLFVPALALMLMAFSGSPGIASSQTQDQAQSNALARGYRTGYSDGYASGYQDAQQRAARDFKNKEEYQLANRNYASTHGSIDDYRDGYQQGFEIGYNAGFDRSPFSSTVPDSLSRRGISSTNRSDAADDSGGAVSADGTIPNTNNPDATASGSGNTSTMGRTVFIPRNTIMRVELLTNLSTDATQRGDRFQARVIEPGEFAGAMLDGRVAQVRRAGKVKGTALLQLSFEQIRLPDNRWTNLSAQVIEVIPNQTSEGVGEVDSEGGVRGEGTTRGDVTKVGAATGIGAVIGAIAGGGKGAAIGAAIGAGIGTASVVTDEGKHIFLRQGQELRVRTANEVTIQ